VPDDVARQRLEQRAAGGRADDADPDAVDRRLSRYHADTEPLLDFYRGKGLLTTVDADRPPEAVTRAILDELGDR
jgi:adenylate kinase